MSDAPEDEEKRKLRFGEALNRHGYSFQNAVIKAAERARDGRRSPWLFEAAEFPVELGPGTKIDFVLWIHSSPWWMIAECKRVNPAYSEWLFVRSPYIRRGRDEAFYVELVKKEPGEFTSVGYESYGALTGQSFYHIGVDVKTNKPGDPNPGRADAIEDAASQVCRGVGGMVHYLYDNPSALGPNNCRALIPVIFTTAKLFTSDVDLKETDLETGKLDPAKLKLTEQPFVYLQYHLSPGVKHRIPRDHYSELASILAADFIRTIPIVTASHAVDFFNTFNPTNFVTQKIQGT